MGTIDMNKVEYSLGVSYKEAMDMLTRSINGLYAVIDALQQRVLELELEADKRDSEEGNE